MKLSKCLFCRKILKKGLCRKFCDGKCSDKYRYYNNINHRKDINLTRLKNMCAMRKERTKYLLSLSAQELIDEVESRGDL